MQFSRAATQFRAPGATAPKRIAWHLGAAFVLALALLTVNGGAAAIAKTTVAKDARLGGDSMRTRFVADLSKKVPFRVFTLADPYRIIVDLPNVDFKLPAGLGEKGRGLVSAFRYGLFAEGKSRIVIDANAPVKVAEAFIVGPRDGQPARLVIDLVRTTADKFSSQMLEAMPGQTVAKASSRSASAAAAVTPAPEPPALNSKPAGKPVIVIDPGHGGVDPGAVAGNSTIEKELVFAFAKVLRDRLEETGRYNVKLTRDTDTYVPLRQRVAIARHDGASLFISIHADSISGSSADSVSGATVYTLSENASDREARALAAKENKADIIAGVDLPPEQDELTGILIDLAQRETKNLSVSFANALLKNMKSATPLNRKPHRFAGFVVLKAPDVPSVLIELGYLTNARDVRRLKSPQWRRKVSDSLADAINRYFELKLARGAY